MKGIPHEDKGILNPKYKINVLGLNFLALQILAGLIREKRVIEFTWGLYCLVRYQPKKIRDYKIDLKHHDYSISIKLAIDKKTVICRSLSCNHLSKVYAEYDQPGARLIYVDANCVKIYDPYRDDLGVYHIHDIINIESDRYLVFTGDSSKYLDEFIINNRCCQRIKRHLRHLGGFTASIKTKETIFLGTDFSYRPNYILDYYSRKKYFLPKQAWLEYIININSEGKNTLTIITKKLNHNVGHKVIFCILEKKFISAKKISIIDKEIHATV